MRKVTLHFKNGLAIEVICENYKFNSALGSIVGYEFSNCQGQIPIHLELSEIIAITTEEIA